MFNEKKSEVKLKNILSVKILHSNMEAGAKIVPSQQFSHSNGIGLIEFLQRPPKITLKNLRCKSGTRITCEADEGSLPLAFTW